MFSVLNNPSRRFIDEVKNYVAYSYAKEADYNRISELELPIPNVEDFNDYINNKIGRREYHRFKRNHGEKVDSSMWSRSSDCSVESARKLPKLQS